MVGQVCPSGLQLNKANTSDAEATFLDLHLSFSNDIVSTKVYDKRDDFQSAPNHLLQPFTLPDALHEM